MPPFLPVMGLNRSNQVRIGGQTVKYGKVTYVDLGQLPVPTGLAITAGEGEGTLAQNTNYNYVITAVDAYGGETPASVEVTKKTENVGATNELKLEWTAVPNATSYNIYRAKNESGKELFLANTTETKYKDTGTATKAGVTPPSGNNTFYNPNKAAVSPKKELKEHTTYGQLVTVGPISSTNLDWVPLENKGWELKLESEKVTVEKAKVLKQRSTGLFQETEVASATVTSFKSTSENEKQAVIWYNPSTNLVESSVSSNEASVSTTALLEKVPAGSQLLYVIRTKGTTKVVENITSVVPNAPVVGRV